MHWSALRVAAIIHRVRTKKLVDCWRVLNNKGRSSGKRQARCHSALFFYCGLHAFPLAHGTGNALFASML